MWWINKNFDPSRGGFQNRDVGRADFDNDYGPEYGIDFARYADPPDPVKDAKMLHEVKEIIKSRFSTGVTQLEIIVRNGFIILKGHVDEELIRENVTNEVWQISGVKEVINQLLPSGQSVN